MSKKVLRNVPTCLQQSCMRQWRRAPPGAGPGRAGAAGGWAGHSQEGCGAVGGRSQGKGGAQVAGETPGQPGGSTLHAPEICIHHTATTK
jgi:hypothetical protein